MSDSYITIVPANVSRDQVEPLVRLTINWLIEKQIVDKNTSDCVMGSGSGYAPGPNYKEAIEGDDFGLLDCQPNGVEILIGRQVFDNGGNGLEEIVCPACGANNIESDWAESIEQWSNQNPGDFKCIECNRVAPIVNYTFQPAWGFGDFGIKFWNWPELNSAFISQLKNVIQKDITIVYGHL